MNEADRTSNLRRYTSFEVAIKTLKRNALQLRPYDKWDDANDRTVLDAYKNARRLKTLLASCLTETSETYLHWKIFTENQQGVCLVFHRPELMMSLMSNNNCNAESVKYLKLEEIRNGSYKTEDLPFLKRYGFRAEKEWRIIYSAKYVEKKEHDIELVEDSLAEVIINPWAPAAAAREMIAKLAQFKPKGEEITFKRSRLISSPTWTAFAEKKWV